MKPITPLSPVKFPEANRKLVADGCNDLWVYTDGVECISCWKLDWRARLSALIHGKIWVAMLSGGTQPPVRLAASKTGGFK